MYQNAAIIAVIVLVYSAVAGRVARSWLSGPILFAAAGLAFGPLGLNFLRLDVTASDLRAAAEASLAMVLFTVAASADLSVARRSSALPRRLLLGARVLFPAGTSWSPQRPARSYSASSHMARRPIPLSDCWRAIASR